MDKKTILAVVAVAIGLAVVVLQKPISVADSAATPPMTELVPASTNPIPCASVRGVPVPAPPSGDNPVACLSAAFLQAWNSTNEGGHDLVFTNLLPALMALDPLAAARLVATIPTESGREELLHWLAHAWGAKDSAAALAWAEQVLDAHEQREALMDVTLQLAQSDAAAAVTTAEHHQLGEVDGALMETLAMLWAGKDLPAALAWAGRQPAGEPKAGLITRIAFIESQTDPVAAVQLVAQEIPPGPAQDEAAISVLNQWAIRDFARAKAWADDFSAGPLHDRAAAELAGIAAHSVPDGNANTDFFPGGQ